MHGLVGAEESHELWHLDDLNITGLVDIEVSPGLGEVSIEVGSEGISRELSMVLFSILISPAVWKSKPTKSRLLAETDSRELFWRICSSSLR